MGYRILFAGTPEFSVAPLQALLDSEHDVVGVYTQPDRPAGRGRKLTPSPVKQLALVHQLPVEQPESLKTTDAQAILASYQADLMIVVAYGLLLPPAVLTTPKLGCLNIHASLLPRWRGAAPIQRAIAAGDAITGITIMQMDAGLDTGPMLYKAELSINTDDTAQTLHDKLAPLGADALLATLAHLPNLTPEVQDDVQACYAAKLTKAEAQLNWQQHAEELVRQIHAFNPWPMAFSLLDEQPLRLLNAEVVTTHTEHMNDQPGEIIHLDKDGLYVACGQGQVRLTQVQPAGKKAMSAYDFAQARNLLGRVLR
ncbi:methionyl-tRNA formyltransferase [Thiomicrospira cyclica]|uniref:Methionyl-tRNA formyltransferase n=1 Tax=Thiomicrospira cyclica (strain DSM 14477 / JCM 11371 / ALM1) TaxID=717773 RepID=F6DAM2_THICA|nr:methionyl-tRNA formyltransferase [Thiomicrospira cyclica]AEG32278.1 Methionyl-tRNA formyltransferase [Thiomicrospira cyclica ALM1]